MECKESEYQPAMIVVGQEFSGSEGAYTVLNCYIDFEPQQNYGGQEMTLPLKESRSIAEMAALLYDFLPGLGRQQWNDLRRPGAENHFYLSTR